MIVVNEITVKDCASLLNCTPTGRASVSWHLMIWLWSGLPGFNWLIVLLQCFRVALFVESSPLFHFSNDSWLICFMMTHLCLRSSPFRSNNVLLMDHSRALYLGYISWWPSNLKELCSWLSVCHVLDSMTWWSVCSIPVWILSRVNSIVSVPDPCLFNLFCKMASFVLHFLEILHSCQNIV